MSTFSSKIWHWLYKRSPNKAANPNPGTMPYDSGKSAGLPHGSEIIDISTEDDGILNSTTSKRKQEIRARGPNGELVRSHTELSIMLCACGHLASLDGSKSKDNQAERKVAGMCYYCQLIYLELASEGNIPIEQVESRSFVCDECAQITESGRLCCPNHYIKVTGPDGGTLFLDPEEQLRLKRIQLTHKIKGLLTELFFEEDNEKEQDNDD